MQKNNIDLKEVIIFIFNVCTLNSKYLISSSQSSLVPQGMYSVSDKQILESKRRTENIVMFTLIYELSHT